MSSPEDAAPRPGRSGRPGWVPRLVALSLSAALGLLACALGLEIFARLSWKENWQDPTAAGAPEPGDLPVYVGVLALAQANANGLHRNVYYRTNSHGFRGPERPYAPPPGVLRIAVTGDSTTMGSGVAEEDRYTDVLDRRLGAGVEFLNVGLSGLNTDAAVGRLEAALRHYRADLFVYGFSLNDIEGPAYRSKIRLQADFAREYWDRVARIERSPSYLWRLLAGRWIIWSSGKANSIGELLGNYLQNPDAWADLVAGLDRFAALARSHGVCAHVLLHTDLVDLDERHPYLEAYDRVERAARERGLTVSQSFPYFERHGGDPEELWVSLFDPHPNRVAHILLADALQDGLAQLPPECLVPRP